MKKKIASLAGTTIATCLMAAVIISFVKWGENFVFEVSQSINALPGATRMVAMVIAYLILVSIITRLIPWLPWWTLHISTLGFALLVGQEVVWGGALLFRLLLTLVLTIVSKFFGWSANRLFSTVGYGKSTKVSFGILNGIGSAQSLVSMVVVFMFWGSPETITAAILGSYFGGGLILSLLHL